MAIHVVPIPIEPNTQAYQKPDTLSIVNNNNIITINSQGSTYTLNYAQFDVLKVDVCLDQQNHLIYIIHYVDEGVPKLDIRYHIPGTRTLQMKTITNVDNVFLYPLNDYTVLVYSEYPQGRLYYATHYSQFNDVTKFGHLQMNEHVLDVAIRTNQLQVMTDLD